MLDHRPGCTARRRSLATTAGPFLEEGVERSEAVLA
jgi:hypothetical protein